MRTGWGNEAGECRFDVPPRFGVTERRMAGLAEAAWRAGGRTQVAGFADNSLVIAQVDAVPIITNCATAIAAAFGLVAGMRLTARHGLAAELVATCDLVALRPEPVPFEASLAAIRGLMLVRGVALPLFDGRRESGDIQIVLSWREVLNRAATTRLQREIGAALRHSARNSVIIDPFSSNSSG